MLRLALRHGMEGGRAVLMIATCRLAHGQL
jgi:hypothetical protein